MRTTAATKTSGRSRPGAFGVGLALAALWVLILQPLGHIALLRALLQTAGPGYSIICTVDGPRLIGDSGRGAAASGDYAPLTNTKRPLPDCCVGGVVAMSSPAVLTFSFGPDSVVVTEARPLPQDRSFDSVATWRLPQPRGPPASIL